MSLPPKRCDDVNSAGHAKEQPSHNGMSFLFTSSSTLDDLTIPDNLDYFDELCDADQPPTDANVCPSSSFAAEMRARTYCPPLPPRPPHEKWYVQHVPLRQASTDRSNPARSLPLSRIATTHSTPPFPAQSLASLLHENRGTGLRPTTVVQNWIDSQNARVENLRPQPERMTSMGTISSMGTLGSLGSIFKSQEEGGEENWPRTADDEMEEDWTHILPPPPKSYPPCESITLSMEMTDIDVPNYGTGDFDGDDDDDDEDWNIPAQATNPTAARSVLDRNESFTTDVLMDDYSPPVMAITPSPAPFGETPSPSVTRSEGHVEKQCIISNNNGVTIPRAEVSVSSTSDEESLTSDASSSTMSDCPRWDNGSITDQCPVCHMTTGGSGDPPVVLTDTDVIFGRGGYSFRHPGNKTYLNHIKGLHDRYKTMSKDEKTRCSQGVVEWVHERGGRFLLRGCCSGNNKNECGALRWHEAPEKMARMKVSQALRQDHTKEGREIKKLRQREREMGSKR